MGSKLRCLVEDIDGGMVRKFGMERGVVPGMNSGWKGVHEAFAYGYTMIFEGALGAKVSLI